jgi:hypothetical protein
MTDTLEKFRAAILDKFTLEDVLLKVADKRFESRYNGKHYW